jgi:S-adenosylmethionine:tRNA-ribosyltransferase-isomerase (queuine synthetase)
MIIDDFDYELPHGLIAQKPAGERDLSRLMTLDRADRTVSHHRFRNIETLLSPSDLVVVNTTKVFPARLLGRKKTGGEGGMPPARVSERNKQQQFLLRVSDKDVKTSRQRNGHCF